MKREDFIKLVNKRPTLVAGTTEERRYTPPPLEKFPSLATAPWNVGAIPSCSNDMHEVLMHINSPMTVPTANTHGALRRSMAKVEMRLSKDEAGLNKLERDWLSELRKREWLWLGIQNITLKLADDCRYSPDFTTVGIGGKIICWETKGFFRDDAKVKIKVAARSFPWIEFVLVTRTAGQFNQKVIIP